MQARIGMWGGSCALRLPKMAVEMLGLSEGEHVELQIEKGSLVVKPSRPHYTLDELIKQTQGLKAPESFDFDAMGDEAL